MNPGFFASDTSGAPKINEISIEVLVELVTQNSGLQATNLHIFKLIFKVSIHRWLLKKKHADISSTALWLTDDFSTHNAQT
jgi:hypothetical protein